MTHEMTNALAATRAGPSGWVGSRVARPARDLDRSVAFYRDVLGLALTGRFHDHDGYDGVFFRLPGGAELELTSGSVQPDGATAEDLLVLYVRTIDEVQTVSARLRSAGSASVAAENPYWTRWGSTHLDPDGYRVVIATRDRAEVSAGDVRIGWHEGPRAELQELFAEAEDSGEELARYLELGRVLVASRAWSTIGHLQLVPMVEPGEIEIKNMAVAQVERGTGVGTLLVAEALRQCRDEGWARVLVATAAADTGNLRFYQRVGFRFLSVERDAFRSTTGYPDPIFIDGIALRDRVWLAHEIPAANG